MRTLLATLRCSPEVGVGLLLLGLALLPVPALLGRCRAAAEQTVAVAGPSTDLRLRLSMCEAGQVAVGVQVRKPATVQMSVSLGTPRSVLAALVVVAALVSAAVVYRRREAVSACRGGSAMR